jgi:hypothetical protein
MQVSRVVRICDHSAAFDHGVSRFAEEDRRFEFWIVPHFAYVIGIVSPNTEDAPHWKAQIAPNGCDRWLRGRREGKLHRGV